MFLHCQGNISILVHNRMTKNALKISSLNQVKELRDEGLKGHLRKDFFDKEQEIEVGKWYFLGQY